MASLSLSLSLSLFPSYLFLVFWQVSNAAKNIPLPWLSTTACTVTNIHPTGQPGPIWKLFDTRFPWHPLTAHHQMFFITKTNISFTLYCFHRIRIITSTTLSTLYSFSTCTCSGMIHLKQMQWQKKKKENVKKKPANPNMDQFSQPDMALDGHHSQ